MQFKRAAIWPPFFYIRTMKTITCPNCQQDTFLVRAKRCTNEECELRFAKDARTIEEEPFSWKRIFWKIWYLRPRRVKSFFMNILWRRYDLVRTGFDKSSWCDVDYRMLYAVMNLVESYVVDEEGIYFVEIEKDMPDWEKEHARKQNKTQKKILELYKDWKVTYPYMCQKLHDILMDDHVNGEAYFAFEEEVEKYENSLMKRAINLRRSMWT